MVVNVNGENTSDDVKKVLSDSKVRKALNLAINRDAIVKNVTKGGQVPAYSYVPEGIPSTDGKDFANKKYFKSSGDVKEANGGHR